MFDPLHNVTDAFSLVTHRNFSVVNFVVIITITTFFSCQVREFTIFVCINCKQQRLTTDRSSSERVTKKEIKMIMACEIVSFKETTHIKKIFNGYFRVLIL